MPFVTWHTVCRWVDFGSCLQERKAEQASKQLEKIKFTACLDFDACFCAKYLLGLKAILRKRFKHVAIYFSLSAYNLPMMTLHWCWNRLCVTGRTTNIAWCAWRRLFRTRWTGTACLLCIPTTACCTPWLPPRERPSLPAMPISAQKRWVTCRLGFQLGSGWVGGGWWEHWNCGE